MQNRKKKKKPVLESHWDVCSQYPPEDWRNEVANDDTRLGYREWVEHQIEMNMGEWVEHLIAGHTIECDLIEMNMEMPCSGQGCDGDCDSLSGDTNK